MKSSLLILQVVLAVLLSGLLYAPKAAAQAKLPKGWVVQNGQADRVPLPVDQAFSMSAMTGRNGNILIRVQMPVGYYLYRDKLKFSANGFTIKNVGMPKAKVKDDEFLGRVNIYAGTVFFEVSPAQAKAAGTLVLRFQGCAEALVCYPPTTKRFAVS